jgi:hypothetical protein
MISRARAGAHCAESYGAVGGLAPGLPELEGPAFGISYSTPMGVLRTRQGIGWRTNV